MNTEQDNDNKTASEIEALICDWNSPSQLATSMENTCKKLAAWHNKLIRETEVRARIDELEKVYGDGEVYVKLPNGFCDIFIRISELKAQLPKESTEVEE